MFICISGDGDEVGDAEGICIPGISVFICGEAGGVAGGICIPGMFIGEAVGDGAGIGIFISICAGEAGVAGEGEAAGMFIPGMLICFC
jgi:hypothetical protein